MTKPRVSDLRYVLLDPSSHAAESRAELDEAYRCWQSVWSDTLRELDGNGQIFSDDFSRQSYVGALFFGIRCVSLGFFHRLNFSSAFAGKDTYFKVWPESAVEQLLSAGPDVIVGSNITVDRDYRGDLGDGVQLKNILIGLMVKTFLASTADAMTGTMRCDRNMHAAAARFGATLLQAGIVHHGVDVELMAFYRKRLLAAGFQFDFNLSVEMLWRNRKDYRKGESDERHQTDRTG